MKSEANPSPSFATGLKIARSDQEYMSLVGQGRILEAAQLLSSRYHMHLSIGLVITIFLVFIVGAAVLPTAFSQWFNANTTGWPVATQTLWPLVPLLGVIVLVAIIAKKAGGVAGKGSDE